MPKEIKNKGEWENALKEAGDKAVIVDFTATWCGPCKMIGPIFKELSECTPELIFLKVDVDEAEDVASEQGVSAMPTFKVYKNGSQVDEMVGASTEKLKALVEKYK